MDIANLPSRDGNNCIYRGERATGEAEMAISGRPISIALTHSVNHSFGAKLIEIMTLVNLNSFAERVHLYYSCIIGTAELPVSLSLRPSRVRCVGASLFVVWPLSLIFASFWPSLAGRSINIS